MNEELNFFLKVLRNGGILAVMYFTSIWASQDSISFVWVKPIIIFLMTYVAGELAIRYKLIPKDKRGIATLIF
ncbi:MAG: hypothetical protein OQK82_02070 [Candidatus Pacearchaeota archaeon]|nr:hypothetical protein [Candidatus Pacearchaeota archaeon]